MSPAERNALLMADAVFGALSKPTLSPATPSTDNAKWEPLIALMGSKKAQEFMFMGDSTAMNLYKHINTRRYLNIDRITGRTYKYVAPGKYIEIPSHQAIAHALSS
jgi:hypothetical protein